MKHNKPNSSIPYFGKKPKKKKIDSDQVDIVHDSVDDEQQNFINDEQQNSIDEEQHKSKGKKIKTQYNTNSMNNILECFMIFSALIEKGYSVKFNQEKSRNVNSLPFFNFKIYDVNNKLVVDSCSDCQHFKDNFMTKTTDQSKAKKYGRYIAIWRIKDYIPNTYVILLRKRIRKARKFDCDGKEYYCPRIKSITYKDIDLYEDLRKIFESFKKELMTFNRAKEESRIIIEKYYETIEKMRSKCEETIKKIEFNETREDFIGSVLETDKHQEPTTGPHCDDIEICELSSGNNTLCTSLDIIKFNKHKERKQEEECESDSLLEGFGECEECEDEVFHGSFINQSQTGWSYN